MGLTKTLEVRHPAGPRPGGHSVYVHVHLHSCLSPQPTFSASTGHLTHIISTLAYLTPPHAPDPHLSASYPSPLPPPCHLKHLPCMHDPYHSASHAIMSSFLPVRGHQIVYMASRMASCFSSCRFFEIYRARIIVSWTSLGVSLLYRLPVLQIFRCTSRSRIDRRHYALRLHTAH